MKDLLFGTRVVVRTSNIRISRHRVADYVKKKRKKKIHKGAWRTCSTIIIIIFILVQPSVSLIFGVVVAFSYSHFSKLKLAKQGKNGPRRNEMLQRKLTITAFCS